MPNLSQKQTNFVLEYEKDGNASAAALRAGYKKRQGQDLGSKTMASPKIKAELERRRKDRNKRHEINLDRILQGLLEIADSDAAPNTRVAAWRAIADIGGFTAPQRIEIDASPLAARLEAARSRLTLSQAQPQLPEPLSQPEPETIGHSFAQDDIDDSMTTQYDKPVLQTTPKDHNIMQNKDKNHNDMLDNQKKMVRRICKPEQSWQTAQPDGDPESPKSGVSEAVVSAAILRKIG